MAPPSFYWPPQDVAVAKPLEHDYLDRHPARPGTKKLPEKSGFFAKIDIPEGTLIYADESTFTATTFINNPNLQKILEEGRQQFPLEREGHAKKVWLNNKGVKDKYPNLASMFSDYAMPLYSLRSERWNGPDFEKIGFFRWMGYFRHGCLPNAHFSYDYINEVGAIHAIRKILKGEEITISYLPESVYEDHMLPNALEVLMNTFGRTCSCKIHTPEGLAEQASKVNFEIERKNRHLLATGTFTSYTEQMAVVYRIYQVLKDYQIRDVRWARVYELGLECAVSHGDLARAVVFAWHAKLHYAMLEGPAGKYGGRIQKMHYFKNNPQTHPKFKSGGPWESRPTQIPRSWKGDRSNAAVTRMLPCWTWMIRGWDKVDPRSDFYKEATGLDGSVPFHFFESDDPVPADIDSRFGPWDTKWPKPPKGKKYLFTPEGLKELVWDDLDGWILPQ